MDFLKKHERLFHSTETSMDDRAASLMMPQIASNGDGVRSHGHMWTMKKWHHFVGVEQMRCRREVGLGWRPACSAQRTDAYHHVLFRKTALTYLAF